PRDRVNERPRAPRRRASIGLQVSETSALLALRLLRLRERIRVADGALLQRFLRFAFFASANGFAWLIALFFARLEGFFPGVWLARGASFSSRRRAARRSRRRS